MDFFKVTSTVLGTATRVLLAQLRGPGDEGSDTTSEPVDGAEVYGLLGLFVRPFLTAHTEAISFRMGDQVVVLSFSDKSLSVFGDVEEGETRLYGAKVPTARLRLRADGSLDLETAGSAALRITATGTGDIVLNGGTLKVARDSDPVRVGTISGTAGPYPVLLTFTPVDANGTPTTPVVGTISGVAVSAVISNAGGAAHVKA